MSKQTAIEIIQLLIRIIRSSQLSAETLWQHENYRHNKLLFDIVTIIFPGDPVGG